MDVALGSAASGVFTNSDWLWEQLHKVLNLLSKHNLIIFVSQLPGWLTGCVCIYMYMCAHTCICTGWCCDRWQSVADASVPALHQTGDWQPAGRPQQHWQIQPVCISVSVRNCSSCFRYECNTGLVSNCNNVKKKIKTKPASFPPHPPVFIHLCHPTKYWLSLTLVLVFCLNLTVAVHILHLLDPEVHVLQLHSSESSSQLLIGPIWTLLVWWTTKMKFLTCGKACLEDQRVPWWSLLLDSLIMAEWLNTSLFLSYVFGINVCVSA